MKKISFLLILLNISLEIVAQTSFGVTNGNSDVNMGKSGSGSENHIGMNLFQGSATIQIPILKKSVDEVDLSVSLVYSTGGIRLNDIASSVGLGWSLNSGGGIHRVVKGIPDEFCICSGVVNGSGYYQGFWHRNNNDLHASSPNPTPISSLESQVEIASGIRDGQMDQFIINVSGFNAEFIITHQNQVHISPSNSRIKVERTLAGVVSEPFVPGNDYRNMGFKITDESGNEYYLESGSKQKATIVTSSGQPYTGADEYYTTAWFLEKIITHEGKQINYQYSGFEDTGFFADRIEEITDYPASGNCYPHYALNDIIQYSKAKRLLKIQFSDIEAEFVYNPVNRIDILNAKSLYEIVIKERSNLSEFGISTPSNSILSRKVRLHHSYFCIDGRKPYSPTYSGTLNVANAAQLDYRLCLDEISSILPNNSQRSLYRFEYFDVNIGPNSHPEDIDIGYGQSGPDTYPYRLNGCQDYWGFYNGQMVTSGLGLHVPIYPNMPANNNAGGIDRNANNKNKLFSLRKIVNESKGVTELKYGLNQAVVNSSVNMNLDGPRLDEVISYTVGMENINKSISKYIYEQGEWLVKKKNGNYPDIFNLFKKKINLICTTPGPGGPPPTFINEIDVVSNKFLGQLEGIQHGYGKVTTETWKSYPSKNGTQTIITNEKLGKNISYFATYHNSPASIINQIGTAISGTFSLNQNNAILNVPTAITNYAGFTLAPGVNYFKEYDDMPYTFKNYSNSLVVGMQYKSEAFDAFDNKTSESNQKINVYVKALNTDDYLNLNAVSKTINTTTSNQTPDASWVVTDYYYPFEGYVELIENHAKSYINNTDFIDKSVFYSYDNDFGKPKVTKEVLPTGEEIENREFYAYENSNWGNSTLSILDQKNKHKIIFSEVWRKKPGGAWKLFNASGSGYSNFNGEIRQKYHYSLKGNSPLTNSPIVSGMYTINDANAGLPISNFERSGEITKYDDKGNLIEKDEKGIKTAMLYDYFQNSAIAIAKNATYEEIAYSSFESNLFDSPNGNNPEINKGNWKFNPSSIKFTDAITGNRCFKLGENNIENGQSQPSSLISGSLMNLTPGKKYVLSFWQKLSNGQIITVEGFDQGNVLAIPFQTYMTNTSSINSLNGWTFCQVEFVATYPKIKITGFGLIDEVRLHPAVSTMLTSYEAPIGGKLFECDASNNIIRYEFDEQNRLSIVRDIQGNILSKTKIAIQELDN